MTPAGRWLLLALALGACSRSGQPEAPSARGSEVLAPAPPASSPAPPALTAKAAAPAVAAEPKLIGPDELKTEEPEANPYSETVTLKLAVTPPVKAQITWGAKTLARVEPGKMEAEITRPRGSGPVDVEVKAEGYLPYHTRLYADRNDKIGVRLYRAEEAPSLFGYRRSAEAKKADAEKPR